MKRHIKEMNSGITVNRMEGFALLEVVLAIAVFAFGMLALVQLQGNLTRSSADANARTVATNIAEELVEDIRGYQQVRPIDGNPITGDGAWEYLELHGSELNHTVTRGGLDGEGGLDYAITATISDFWWDATNDQFIRTDATDPPSPPEGLGQAYADFKLLQITVAWGTSQDFYVDDDTTAELGPGSITVHEVIPSSPPALGAKIAADLNALGGGPTANYTPGLNPEIVALRLNDQRLKESTTPVPDIIRDGELTETYFEVVSYNNANTFLRREEFVTVGCECALNGDGAEGFGRRPTVWNGVEYTEGERVLNKDVGVSANSQQSVFCDVCCRDHHDGGSSAEDAGLEDERLVYDPWNFSAANKNHSHFGRDKKGAIYEALDGDIYLEACRLVRKDGFFRVAQDFNQQGFFAMPDNYLDNLAEVGEYSDYVIAAVSEFYTSNPDQEYLPKPGDEGMPSFTNPANGGKYPHLPASTGDVLLSGPPTPLPTVLGFENQQLRSRGIYLDYMTNEVKAKIERCKTAVDGVGCEIPNYNTPLEVYPFFEVQLTNLTTWDEDPLNLPVDVTNESIEPDNNYSRGRADLVKTGMGPTKADFSIHKGNVGIAATDPIRPNDPKAAKPKANFVHIETVDDGEPPFSGFEVRGEIVSGVGGVRAADVVITFKEAECGRTATGYRCIVPPIASNPTLTVSNYYKNNQMLYACSDPDQGGLGEGVHVHGVDNSTTFKLPAQNKASAKIVIQNTPCQAVAP